MPQIIHQQDQIEIIELDDFHFREIKAVLNRIEGNRKIEKRNNARHLADVADTIICQLPFISNDTTSVELLTKTLRNIALRITKIELEIEQRSE